MDRVVIKNFFYSQGDLSLPGKKGLPPTIKRGQQLTFVNEDAPLTERFHTITACKAPCNLTPGIGYPLANGLGGFDSGELGYGPTIDTGLYGGGSQTVPISAVINTPTAKANCKTVPGLLSIISNGCVGTVTYKTPKNLAPGTYAYFCRIHPFMRGAFRVKN
jgi:plastocyanin